MCATPRIHFEAFGPVPVVRHAIEMTISGSTLESVLVTFAKTGKTVFWQSDQGSLLDLAERAGVAPLSSCRSGVCGTCVTKVLQGAVDYNLPPSHDVENGEALLCIATPRAGPHIEGTTDREGITLDL